MGRQVRRCAGAARSPPRGRPHLTGGGPMPSRRRSSGWRIASPAYRHARRDRSGSPRPRCSNGPLAAELDTPRRAPTAGSGTAFLRSARNRDRARSRGRLRRWTAPGSVPQDARTRTPSPARRHPGPRRGATPVAGRSAPPSTPRLPRRRSRLRRRASQPSPSRVATSHHGGARPLPSRWLLASASERAGRPIHATDLDQIERPRSIVDRRAVARRRHHRRYRPRWI